MKKRCVVIVVFVLFCQCLFAQQQDSLISVHDPVMIKQNHTFYIFCTGWGISVFSSNDMKHWTNQSPVFKSAPQWAVQAIPNFKGHIWAPDISYHNGQYYLYYAVSAFGKNTSAIGVATNKTLDTSSGDFKWVDHGKVLQSVPNRDMWNAIDPNLITDDKTQSWLAFGSFWNGIKLVKMSPDLLSIENPEKWYSIANRKRDFLLPDSVAGDAAIEGPFIFKKEDYYYLFVSFNYCCRGVKSTYKMMVGRSKDVYGTYVDKDGVSMNVGGGSLLLEGDKKWYGVGHNAVVTVDDKDYLVFHGYDAYDKGKPKLRIEELVWKNGFPEVKLELVKE